MREVYHDPRDGEVECSRCATRLNRTDRLCWKCGSEKLNIVGSELKSLMAVRDALDEQIGSDAEFKRRMVKGKWPVPTIQAPHPGVIPGGTLAPPGIIPATHPAYGGAGSSGGGSWVGQMKMGTCPHGLDRCNACMRYKCSDMGYCQPCWQKSHPNYVHHCPAGDPNNVIQP